jgi:hypothetical protein
MPRHSFSAASSPSAARAVGRGAAIESLWTVNQRLANAERELRLQFIRIAQLQAQLDVVLRALRRSPKGSSCVMSVSADVGNSTADANARKGSLREHG